MSKPGSSGKAAVMTGVGVRFAMRKYPLPPVKPGEVLVRVLCCTICKSDLHTWMGRRPGPTPIILGHEIVGRIVELGDGVERDSGDRPLAPGDRITWTIMGSCGKCYYCREKGLPMKCRELTKYGHDSCAEPPHFTGGFAEYCLLTPGTCVIKVPDTVPDEVAAPANCALATVIAGWEAGAGAALENVLIQGAGGLGCYAAAYARHAGARRVIVTDVDPARLELVRLFGATDVVDVSGLEPGRAAERVRDLCGGMGADCAFEVAGTPAAIPVGLASLRKGGRYVEIGCSFPGAHFTVDASLILWNRLTITGCHNYDTRHLQAAIDFLETAADRYPFGRLVTHTYPLERIDEAMTMAESGQALRVAVKPS